MKRLGLLLMPILFSASARASFFTSVAPAKTGVLIAVSAGDSATLYDFTPESKAIKKRVIAGDKLEGSVVGLLPTKGGFVLVQQNLARMGGEVVIGFLDSKNKYKRWGAMACGSFNEVRIQKSTVHLKCEEVQDGEYTSKDKALKAPFKVEDVPARTLPQWQVKVGDHSLELKEPAPVPGVLELRSKTGKKESLHRWSVAEFARLAR